MGLYIGLGLHVISGILILRILLFNRNNSEDKGMERVEGEKNKVG